MKRLIKKSELYNSIKLLFDEYYEVFKNPTSKEWEECSKSKNIRAIIDDNNDLYIWDSDFLHYKAINILKVPNGLKIVVNDKKETAINIEENVSINDLKNKLQNANSSLFNYISLNSNIKFYSDYGVNVDNLQHKIKTINDLFKYSEDDINEKIN